MLNQHLAVVESQLAGVRARRSMSRSNKWDLLDPLMPQPHSSSQVLSLSSLSLSAPKANKHRRAVDYVYDKAKCAECNLLFHPCAVRTSMVPTAADDGKLCRKCWSTLLPHVPFPVQDQDARAVQQEAARKLFGASSDLVGGAVGSLWWYIDQEGATQGPFTGEQMLRWFLGNYLDGDIPVCSTDSSFTAVHLPPECVFQKLRECLANVRQGGAVVPVSYMDVQRIRNGEEPPSTTVVVPDEDSQALDDHKFQRALFFGFPGSFPVRWFYIDEYERMQGPFKAKEMLNWLQGGYLKDDLQLAGVRSAQEPMASSFINLSDLKATLRNGIHPFTLVKPKPVQPSLPPSWPPSSTPDTCAMECPICLDGIRDLSTTPCGHLFCEGCIQPVIERMAQCPVCRTPVTPLEIIRITLP